MNKYYKYSNLKARPVFDFVLKVISSRYFLLFTLLWFALQGIYMAVSTKHGIPPDEPYHYQYIKLFAENGLSPWLKDQEGFYILGEATKNPFFLYHYLLSFPFRIFNDSNTSILLLRLINIGMGLLSLVYIYKIGNLLKFSKAAKNLTLFMLANTVMFVFLSASINYDNLFILITLICIYLMLIILKSFDTKIFLVLCSLLAIGLLVKISFIPVLLSIVAIIFITYFKKPKVVTKDAVASFRKSPVVCALLTLVLFAALFFSAGRYISNMLNYGDYMPACDSVLTVEQCRENFVYRRSNILNDGEKPKVSISTFEYVARWTSIMRERMFGILAHRTTEPTRLIATWSQVLLIITIVVVARRYKFTENKLLNAVLFISVIYTVALIYENYSSYYRRGMIDLAVQGRYIFPFIAFVFLLTNEYLLSPKKKYLLVSSYVIITLFVFASASLPSYIVKTDSNWYTTNTKRINSALNKFSLKIYNY